MTFQCQEFDGVLLDGGEPVQWSDLEGRIRDDNSDSEYTITRRCGVVWRLHMPGYMDATDWLFAATTQEAASDCLGMYFDAPFEDMTVLELDEVAGLAKLSGCRVTEEDALLELASRQICP